MTCLAFITPVRHPLNASDWGALKHRLWQTARSIAAQAHGDWRAYVIANEGADLPDLPPGFEIVHVDFPPNPHYRRDQTDRALFEDAVRFDKGRRILAGMLRARAADYLMVVDDDDLVSRRLVSHVVGNAGQPGWKIKRGFLWNEGGGFLYPHEDFYHFCGTSHIVRTDLMQLPVQLADADPEYVKTMLGSHVMIADKLAASGTPLADLPFRGAVYRVGYGTSHSVSDRAENIFVRDNWSRRRPDRIIRAALRMRRISLATRREFFAESLVGGMPDATEGMNV